MFFERSLSRRCLHLFDAGIGNPEVEVPLINGAKSEGKPSLFYYVQGRPCSVAHTSIRFVDGGIVDLTRMVIPFWPC